MNFQGLNVDISIQHLMNCGYDNFRMTGEHSKQKTNSLRKCEIRPDSANMPNVYSFINLFRFTLTYPRINSRTFKNLETQIQKLSRTCGNPGSSLIISETA